MKATVVDLRYKMNDVLKALARNEKVQIFCHGKKKGTIIPAAQTPSMRVDQHPYFGMTSDAKKSVEETMKELRRGRYDDL